MDRKHNGQKEKDKKPIANCTKPVKYYFFKTPL